MRVSSCSLSLVLQNGGTVVTRCSREGRKKCPGPWRRTPSPLQESHCPPHSHYRGAFPHTAHLRCRKHAHGARLPESGRAGETLDGSGMGSESCQWQPAKHHPAPGVASLNVPNLASTSSTTSQAGQAVAAPEDKQREM